MTATIEAGTRTGASEDFVKDYLEAAGEAARHAAEPTKTEAEERGAVGVHHTDTTDASWDGPANKKRVRQDESLAYYRKIYAWQDPEKDAKTKSAWRFIHHQVDSSGDPGAANVAACVTGIGVLNGARGGTTIPSGDRPGVWRHLAAHLRDADREPPELKSFDPDGLEWRTVPFSNVEVRGGEGPGTLDAYAAVFEVLSLPIWGIREKIKPGAFRESLERRDDIRCLFNHSPFFVLGRSNQETDTLRLEEDDHGLHIVDDIPDTTWARDLAVSIKRRDITQCSFCFRCQEEEFDHEQSIRTIKRADLIDVSVVTYPAYPQTEAHVRMMLQAVGLGNGEVQRAQEYLRKSARSAASDTGKGQEIQASVRWARYREQHARVQHVLIAKPPG